MTVRATNKPITRHALPQKCKKGIKESMKPTQQQIKAHRAACGLTQTAYGALVGAKLRTVQDWESGARKMPPSKWELVQIKAAK